MKKLFRQTIKNRAKTATSEMRAPFTPVANEGEFRKSASDLYKTVGTIYRPDIVARGIFSKNRSLVLNKLLFCPVSRYFLLKFYNLSFSFAKFILGGCMSFFHYVHLFVNESDPLSKDFVTLNRRDCGEGSFNTVNPESEIHNKNQEMSNAGIMDELESKINKKATNAN